jgi:hypothetical protein
VDLHQLGVGMTITHLSIRLVPCQALGQPGIGVRGIASKSGFEP